MGIPLGYKYLIPKKGHPLKQFCLRGHDTFICGRYIGYCNDCKEEKLAKLRKGPKPRTRFCPKGHDKDITGRYKGNQCKICSNEYIPVTIDARIRQVCSKGHKISIVGRDPDGHCVECRRLRGIEYRQRNKEKELKRSEKYRLAHIKESQLYYINNKEKIDVHNKQYAKEHPEILKAISIKHNAKRSLRVVAWTDWDKIAGFEKTQPIGMTEDHIIPLCGRKVAGLHVSWNLQWLTGSTNSSKNNRIDLLWASEWYGKILEEAGLKIGLDKTR